MDIADISLWRLSLGLGFVFAIGVTSVVHHLGLVKDIAIGTVRTIVQLFALGYVLKYVFQLDNVWLVLGVFLIMTTFAAQIARSRIGERQISLFWPLAISMVISYSLTLLFL